MNHQGDIDIHERVARQEVIIEELSGKIEGLSEKVEELTKSITHYKGFVGGIIFVFTCLTAFIKLLPINLGFLHK